MTKNERLARYFIRKWCLREKMTIVAPLRHVHARAYVVGRAAPGCLIVAECWADSEPHLRGFNKENTLRTIRKFDPSLKAGDWCMTAYVSTPGCSEVVAVPVRIE